MNKPIDGKNYGSIAHLPNSRMGEGDHHCHQGQASILTIKKRDKNDEIIVQEKLDGSNVGILRKGKEIYPITRAGYLANTSPYYQHIVFYKWVLSQKERWLNILKEGERLCGEWLLQAHSTKYNLNHEPFVAFDLMIGQDRLPYDIFLERIKPAQIISPYLIHRGEAISVEEVMKILGDFGFHGAKDKVEGAVWRVERNLKIGKKVDFLCKYVRPEKIDGIYLPERNGGETIFNIDFEIIGNIYENFELINN